MKSEEQSDQCIRLVRFYFGSGRPRLLEEIGQAQEMLAKVVKVNLHDHQVDAVVSLLSDIVGGFTDAPKTDMQMTRLFHALNLGHRHIAVGEFASLCYVKGKMSEVLFRKRECEQTLFLTGKLCLK
jgi:GH24 family phage-related lysozyme (muramidase)